MTAALSRWARRILPFFLVRFALRLFFRVEIRGIERLAAAGPRVLVVANHVSSLDAVVLSALLPGRMLFATHAEIAQRWWLKPYWRIGDDCSLDQAHPMTAKTMVDALKRGRVCVIFPEGRPTTTGALMKVYESPGMIADKADAAILPIRIEGLEYIVLLDAWRRCAAAAVPESDVDRVAAETAVLAQGCQGPQAARRRRHATLRHYGAPAGRQHRLQNDPSPCAGDAADPRRPRRLS